MLSSIYAQIKGLLTFHQNSFHDNQITYANVYLPRDFFTDSFLPKCENVAKFYLEYEQNYMGNSYLTCLEDLC